ncbi:pentapeptide repeat-containing protein [Saccharothrix texasensis]|uniref:pentapeptide repeat-containing protein n=1 Tax=Saccharothrix texasensis TaxID=103734 RepID=UPI0014776EB1|nr:pentapeptide repeat-containing protein [Saccharothrix texasensis]
MAARPNVVRSRRPRLASAQKAKKPRDWQAAIATWQAAIAAFTALAAVGAVIFSALTVNASREAQFTDRYTKAIDQLDKTGADHLQARLGGIYALERLGKDSARDQPAINEVLSAFIRSTTPPPETTWPKTTPSCPDKPVATDVQTALTVLGRRDFGDDEGVYPDLSGACLRRADLRGANLAGANLSNASLSGSDLTGAWLTAANLRNARFDSEDSPHTSLIDANLKGADLSGAKFDGAYLGGADLTMTKHNGDTSIKGAHTSEDTKGRWW